MVFLVVDNSDGPVFGPGPETDRNQHFRKMEDRKPTENRNQKSSRSRKKNLVQKWRLFGKILLFLEKKGLFEKFSDFFFKKGDLKKC